MSVKWKRVESQLAGVVDNPTTASPGAEADGVEGALILIEDVRAQAALSAAILEALEGGETLVRPATRAVEFDPGFRSTHLQERTLELLAEIHRDRRSSVVPEPARR